MPGAFVFTTALCNEGRFLANFFFGDAFFLASFFLTGLTGLTFFAEVFRSALRFFFSFFFMAIGAVYHRHIPALKPRPNAGASPR